MQVYYDFENLSNIKNPVVTTGTFDGVHFGHQVIIDRLNRLAAEINGESVLITFHPHPRKVLYPDTKGKALQLINSQPEKIIQLERAGLNHVIIVTFTREFSNVTSEQFVNQYLISKLRAKKIVVGFNHYFGHNKEGDYAYLHRISEEYNFSVEQIPEQELENETVSSTIIRKALKEGRIQRANAYLNHFFNMVGRLNRGHAICKNAGFPTFSVEIEEKEKLIPPEGVYAATVICNNKKMKAMLNIKKFHDQTLPSVQIHIFNYDSSYNFIGRHAEVTFHKRMREELQLLNHEELQQQLFFDKQEIESLIY